MSRVRQGFTLVELLVVITIIGILIALLMPAVQQAREAARRTQCVNNLKQIGLALTNYSVAMSVFPPARVGCEGWMGQCSGSYQYRWVGTSGFVVLLPYVEQQNLYDSFDFTTGPWRAGGGWEATNHTAVATRIGVFECPSDVSERIVNTSGISAAVGSYAFCAGSNGPGYGISAWVKTKNTGVFYYAKCHTPQAIRDGLSNTIFVGETIEGHTTESRNFWSNGGRHLSSMRSTQNPINTPPDKGIVLNLYGYKCSGAFASDHLGGANFVFGDGHVAFLGENIDLWLYKAISTRAGKETIDAAGLY